jgi:hypothetical protein
MEQVKEFSKVSISFRSNASDLIKIMYQDPTKCYCVNDFLKFGSSQVILKMLNYLVSIGYLDKLNTYPKFFKIK